MIHHVFFCIYCFKSTPLPPCHDDVLPALLPALFTLLKCRSTPLLHFRTHAILDDNRLWSPRAKRDQTRHQKSSGTYTKWNYYVVEGGRVGGDIIITLVWLSHDGVFPSNQRSCCSGSFCKMLSIIHILTTMQFSLPNYYLCSNAYALVWFWLESRIKVIVWDNGVLIV